MLWSRPRASRSASSPARPWCRHLARPEPLPGEASLYSLIARLLAPALRWSRARVSGIEHLSRSGPLLIVPNHDSQWDPVVIALALRRQRRLRFLARASLWRIPGLGPLLGALHQIPIERGAHDVAALERAIAALREGQAICVFPEGRLSRGEHLRAHTGVSRLAAAVPEAEVVLCSVSGTTDFVRFPKRPRVAIEFFTPTAGGFSIGEDEAAFAKRLLDDLRERVPPVTAGR